MDICSGEVTRPGQAPGDYTLLFDAWEEHCGRPKRGGGSRAGTPTADRGAYMSGVGGGEGVLGSPGEPEGQVGAEPSVCDSAISGGGGGGGGELLGDTKKRGSWQQRGWELAVFCLAYVASTAHEGWDGAMQWLAALVRAATGGRLLRWAGSVKEGDEGWEGRGRPAAGVALRRAVPGFLRQYRWCLSRAMLKRSREPLKVFIDYAIIAGTGGWVQGGGGERWRGWLGADSAMPGVRGGSAGQVVEVQQEP